MIEITSFRLTPGAGRSEFEEADSKVQTHFAYQQAGLLRRTTARNDGGDWVVIAWWRSDGDADAAAQVWNDDDAAAEFMSLVDATTVRNERYATLG